MGMKLKNRVREIAVLGLLAGGMANAGVMSTAVTPGSADVAEQDSPEVASLKYSFWSEMDFDDVDGGFDMHSVNLQVPVMGKRGTDFSWGVDLEAEYTQFNSRGPILVQDADLYKVGLNASFIWNNVGNSKWSPALSLQPSIATDFEDVDYGDAFRLTTFAGAFYQQQSNLKWLFGVAYTDLGRDQYVFPLAGFSWQPNDVWDVTLLGPRIDVTYKVSSDVKVGLFADAHSRSWDIENAGNHETLSVFSARAGARVDYQVFQSAWIFVEAGATFANNAELHDSSDNELFDEDADGGFFANFGLRYQF